jgi:hypothetical protein
MNQNSEGRYEFERNGQTFSITPEIRASMIEAYMANQDADAWDNPEALRAEAEDYVDQPQGWTDQELAELELHARYSRTDA